MIKYAHAKQVDNMEVRRAVRWLRDRGRHEFNDGTYHAYISPYVEADLLSDPGISHIYSYSRGENNPLMKGALPSVYGISFYRVAEQPPIEDGDYVLITKSPYGKEHEMYTSVFRSADEVPGAVEIDWSHKLPTDIS